MVVKPSISPLRLLFGAALMLLGWTFASMTVAHAEEVGVLGNALTSSTLTATVDAAPTLDQRSSKTPAAEPVTTPTTRTVKAGTSTVRSATTKVETAVAPLREVEKKGVAPVREVKKVVEPVVRVVKTTAAHPNATSLPTLDLMSLSVPGALGVAVPVMLEPGVTVATADDRRNVVDMLVDRARTERAAAFERALGEAAGTTAAMLHAAMSASLVDGEQTSANPGRGHGPMPIPAHPVPGLLTALGSAGATGSGSPDHATAEDTVDLADPSSATSSPSGGMWMSPGPVDDPGSRPD